MSDLIRAIVNFLLNTILVIVVLSLVIISGSRAGVVGMFITALTILSVFIIIRKYKEI